MINLKDEKDVQIWCDYQEEIKQTDTSFFLRLRFANFCTFVVNIVNYGDGNGYSAGDSEGYGDGYGYSFGNVWGNGDGYGWGCGYSNSFGDGYGYGNGLGYGLGYGFGYSHNFGVD